MKYDIGDTFHRAINFVVQRRKAWGFKSPL